MNIHANLIGGAWSEAGERTPNINPSDTSDIVGEYAYAGPDGVAAAVAAAREASLDWALSNPQARFDLLDKAGSEILARKEELGRLLAREEGKTLPEAVGEAARAGAIFKFFAGEALRGGGELIPSVRPGVGVEITREPVGVVGLITPWNFPIAIPAWKLAPALAYANCAILKPAELAPGCAWELVDILHRAGAPPGVVNLVMGAGAEIGAALTGNPGVDAVSFTGSQAVGAHVGAACLKRGARAQLEMGGKNPLIVLDDADLVTAVNVAVNGAFFSTGQRCTASSRIIVTAGIAERFVAALRERVQKLVVDDALKAGTEIGPVVDARQLAKDLDYVKIGRDEGARLLAGGERLKRDREGFYMSPALFGDTTPEMRINREEIFGPVATVLTAKDYEEALHLANDTPFGLCAGIVTTSLKHATHFKRHAQVGIVMVNLPTAGVDYHVPFGGRKTSSYGPREQGSYAREFYTTVKTAYSFVG